LSVRLRRVEKKLFRRERIYETEQLMKEKRSEEKESPEEVFDRSTLMIVYKLMNKGVIGKIFGVVKSGKEARIYWAQDSTGKDMAVKIFLTTSAVFKKGRQQYIEGDVRFGRARRGARSLVYQWASKEFRNLQAAHGAGVSTPRPLRVQGNVLLLEFLGAEGAPLPLLREVELVDGQKVYDQVLENLARLYKKAELVHGDVSEYNIMMRGEDPVLIDFAQAVHTSHPLSGNFLRRDIQNLNSYFSKLGTKVLDEAKAFDRIVS